jgi:hypothetical protein
MSRRNNVARFDALATWCAAPRAMSNRKTRPLLGGAMNLNSTDGVTAGTHGSTTQAAALPHAMS